MNILVCVKQVPDTAEFRIDPATNNIIRRGIPSIVNPFDLYALEMAVRLKEEHLAVGITALSMGSRQAEATLRHCLSIGADKAYLASDSAFAGADTLATSYVLAKAIRCIEAEEGPFHLILCGKQAIDGDTAQTGPELAEHLGYPQVTCVKEIYLNGDGIQAIRESSRGFERWESSLPAVMTISTLDFEPRSPTAGAKLAAKRAIVRTLRIEDIQAVPERCGLKGSPTAVRETFTLPQKARRVLIDGKNAREAGETLAALLIEGGRI